jgi:type IV pilus assembly protein PilP
MSTLSSGLLSLRSARSGLVLGLALLGGCEFLVDGQGTRDRNQKNKAGPVAPEADAKKKKKTVEPEFVYNPIGKRDPFRSFLTVGEVGAGDGPKREGLQKYELDQYQLVGVIWGVERPRALLQDPDQVGHVGEIGTYIGRNWGKITAITSGEVVVTEEYQTIDGELVVNNIPLTLPVDPAGAR